MAYLTTTGSGQPVLILKEGTTRSRGKEAQRNNIMAARVIGEVLKTTLGPRGMDKMLIDSLGDITITNDGAAILKEIDVEHPAAKMMVEIAKTQDDMVGDGTTSAVVLSSELLKKAEELLEQNIHPTILVSGFRKAGQKAIEIINKTAQPLDTNDKKTLLKVALTSMSSKSLGSARDHLAEITIEAVKQITEQRGDKTIADIDNIQLIKKTGKSLLETQLIKGIIIDKEVVNPGMPKLKENAKVVLLDSALEIEKTEISAEIRIKDPSQMKAFLDQETTMMQDMVTKIKASGANIVFCQKGIDDMVQHFLAKEGIIAARRVKESDMEKLARATGGRIVSDLDDLKKDDLGFAGLVEERKIGDDKLIFVEKCKDPHAVAILIRAGLERLVDEAERAMTDSLSVVSDVIENNQIVPGGGAIEIEIAKELRKYATKVGGREQLAVEAFADAVEVIPRTLAENAGLEPIDIIVELRSVHDKDDGKFKGLNVFTGKLQDSITNGVIEPIIVKEQAIKSASESAALILRIDDVITAKAPKAPAGPPGGMED
ncbi:MAG: TCP-1/cpn60 chaperonin family protein [Nitrososphaerota archaeon]|jgi:thermosome|uniref:thermosome subunit beta n=1 Tax=Candidatus Bathycorpusculum sp. TaxID=2994959 RepID=UPI002831B592|nr:TCP-1/cpn60 chaperonin family protein [Candidatus Termitimicrobium sp.]MCL2431179.1 TCP-1/cpn60 chaperonin family protein [Candidatus Termitimicrobium sp.]MDR0492305.1 TCP-1/cpn60 chaperonin family protein [Nitrososphaerota archaeon]